MSDEGGAAVAAADVRTADATQGTLASSAAEADSAVRPLVGIGMPLYNEAGSVAAAIEAILAQDYPNFELIISDNASTDDTLHICQDYARRDPRIRCLRNGTNEGLLRNFNKVFQRSRGEFFAWAGGHDRWDPRFLSRCLAPLLADETVVLAHPQTVFFGPDDEPVGRSLGRLDTRDRLQRLSRFNIVLWSLGQCFEVYGLFRASALKQTGGFAEVYATDYVLLLELAFLGTFAHVPEPLLRARQPIEDKEATLRKYFGRTMSRREALGLYRRFLFRNMGTIVKHVRSLHGKLAGVLIFLICAMTKDRWMFRVLWSYSPSRREEARIAD